MTDTNATNAALGKNRARVLKLMGRLANFDKANPFDEDVKDNIRRTLKDANQAALLLDDLHSKDQQYVEAAPGQKHINKKTDREYAKLAADLSLWEQAIEHASDASVQNMYFKSSRRGGNAPAFSQFSGKAGPVALRLRGAARNDDYAYNIDANNNQFSKATHNQDVDDDGIADVLQAYAFDQKWKENEASGKLRFQGGTPSAYYKIQSGDLTNALHDGKGKSLLTAGDASVQEQAGGYRPVEFIAGGSATDLQNPHNVRFQLSRGGTELREQEPRSALKTPENVAVGSGASGIHLGQYLLPGMDGRAHWGSEDQAIAKENMVTTGEGEEMAASNLPPDARDPLELRVGDLTGELGTGVGIGAGVWLYKIWKKKRNLDPRDILKQMTALRDAKDPTSKLRKNLSEQLIKLEIENAKLLSEGKPTKPHPTDPDASKVWEEEGRKATLGDEKRPYILDDGKKPSIFQKLKDKLPGGTKVETVENPVANPDKKVAPGTSRPDLEGNKAREELLKQQNLSPEAKAAKLRELQAKIRVEEALKKQTDTRVSADGTIKARDVGPEFQKKLNQFNADALTNSPITDSGHAEKLVNDLPGTRRPKVPQLPKQSLNFDQLEKVLEAQEGLPRHQKITPEAVRDILGGNGNTVPFDVRQKLKGGGGKWKRVLAYLGPIAAIPAGARAVTNITASEPDDPLQKQIYDQLGSSKVDDAWKGATEMVIDVGSPDPFGELDEAGKKALGLHDGLDTTQALTLSRDLVGPALNKQEELNANSMLESLLSPDAVLRNEQRRKQLRMSQTVDNYFNTDKSSSRYVSIPVSELHPSLKGNRTLNQRAHLLTPHGSSQTDFQGEMKPGGFGHSYDLVLDRENPEDASYFTDPSVVEFMERRQRESQAAELEFQKRVESLQSLPSGTAPAQPDLSDAFYWDSDTFK